MPACGLVRRRDSRPSVAQGDRERRGGDACLCGWLRYFRALQIGDAGQVAPLDKLSVVLVAVFGAVFRGERLSALNWLGVVLIAGGGVLVAVR